MRRFWSVLALMAIVLALASPVAAGGHSTPTPDDPPVTVPSTDPEPITDLPDTGAGPSAHGPRVASHTGWHATNYFRCDSWGRQLQLYSYLQATSSGGHTATTVASQWFYTGRWC